MSILADLAWLRAQLERHTYRPNWRMAINDERPTQTSVWMHGGDHHLVVKAIVQNSYQPDRQIEIASRSMVPPYLAEMRDELEFTRWLQQAIFDIEMHESREWLRRDGKLFDNPHAARAVR